MLVETVASGSRKDKLFALMDSNARTGKRDVLNDNGEHLVRTATDRCGYDYREHILLYPERWPTVHLCPKGDAWRLDYILTRHADLRLIRNITVYPVLRAESDHSIVAATIRLCGRFAPNRPKRPANRHPRIDRQMLVNNSDIRRDLARAIDNELHG